MNSQPLFKSTYYYSQGERALLAAPLSHLENDFQLDRGAERKARDAIY
jgi:hypothetical protein